MFFVPISHVPQPEILTVSKDLRLRKFDGCFRFAFAWYQDEETVYLVDGVRRSYSWETLSNMYHYLDKHGELYFIEVKENGAFRPIGDVTFSREDMPIVIGDPPYRQRGIGKQVIAALIKRGRQLGFKTLGVAEIYDWNQGSRRCFESMGFRVVQKTEKGARYTLQLQEVSQ